MIRLVVVDTNVVVAGLLTKQADSPVARVLDGMLAARFAFVLSPALLAEYRQVMWRDRVRRLHGLALREVETLLVDLARHAAVLQPPSSPRRAPDAGDQHLWDLLADRHDLLLVTGDKRLLADAAMRGRVLTPRDFVGQGWAQP